MSHGVGWLAELLEEDKSMYNVFDKIGVTFEAWFGASCLAQLLIHWNLFMALKKTNNLYSFIGSIT